jgi:hypothetical protein
VEATLASVPDDDPDLRAAIIASLGLKQTARKLSPEEAPPKSEQSMPKTPLNLQLVPSPFRKRTRGVLSAWK